MKLTKRGQVLVCLVLAALAWAVLAWATWQGQEWKTDRLNQQTEGGQR